ncbi:MAG: PHP domain-containing protein [Desulfurococcaceae archaeon]
MLLKADLHIHSSHSDGKASPVEILYTALDYGLNIISITDHDTFSGSISALKLASSIGIVVIPGVEVRTNKGDILLYCESEIDFPRIVDKLIEKAHSENCLVVPAHPFDILRLGVGDYLFETKQWDAIEIWNASANKGANMKAINAAMLLGKPGLANSDAHLPSEIGVAYTIIETQDLKIEYILEAIRKNHVKPVFKSIPLKSRIDRIIWNLDKIINRRRAGSL